MTRTDLRSELPDVPARIAALPVRRGYPVPWFVAWLDGDGDPVERGRGDPEFRVLAPGAIAEALRDRSCWICGQRLGRYVTFVVGPMCAVNRTSAEPPSHAECADWSARACPFLTRPKMERRGAGMPVDAVEPAGIMLRRNPGVALLWTTREFAPFKAGDGSGVLIQMGAPVRVEFYAEGRPATRAEVEASIETGLPTLAERAEAQGERAVRALNTFVAEARELLPA